MPLPNDERFLALAKNHPLTPSVLVEIHDRLKAGRFEKRLSKHSPQSPDRMKIALQALDVRANAFLKLVDNIDLQEFFITVLNEIARTAWQEFASFPIEKANFESPDARRYRKMITDRTDHWQAEGFRRLMPKTEPMRTRSDPKRGYRAHVRAWMKDNEITTTAAAAKHLGVSIDTLKSVMSSKGRARYSKDTLADILKKTGFEQ